MEMQKSVAATPTAVYSPTPVPVEQFIDGIRELARGLITKQTIYEYLCTYRNEMIEVMLICWPVGAVTPLHTHNGQLGWMTMIEGKLIVENYRKIDCNRPENQQVVGMDCLAGATRIEMKHLDTEMCAPGGPLNTVDKTQTIHRIKNLPEWNERALSLHVYSRPIDSCVVFDVEAQRCFRRDLKYDNE